MNNGCTWVRWRYYILPINDKKSDGFTRPSSVIQLPSDEEGIAGT
jgi:hypothetical protein